ncbi:type II toxin-antitoxin system HicA family toxin [Ligilactobacillus sp. MP3]|uniref:type II toxin-antitoxin system HicA family toxin n=1 Tax=Ligilactobacillus sp. MP3 TaxID=2965103 RepID=UPI00210D8C99|nr:type II toxin-antitoxin system HicA family toxin [Ligilactobacillus sp. MP3]MCQ4117077.1 type II toxin-antitoxin system HicA family toxin [Ligilactobacillus sp. MP3]
MQRFKLEKLFRKKSWYLLRHGSNHDLWTNGTKIEEIPRHPEVKERLAKHLINKHHLK